jgi:predicted RNase H-like nuclease (RuvC/YqgF family)
MTEFLPLITAIVGAVLGGGGFAAYVRARGQNKVDMLGAYEQRIARLEEREAAQSKEQDNLQEANMQLRVKQAELDTTNASLHERLITQRKLIDDLREQTAQIEPLREENAQLRQQLFIEQSKVRILEKEAKELRGIIDRQQAEIVRLQQRLSVYENGNEGTEHA